MIGIYKITNKINGKVYIGQSIDIEKRWKDHIYNTPKKGRSLIHSSIKKYGVESFDFEIIFSMKYVDFNIMNLLEEAYIRYYNSLSPNGYNLDSGGKNKRPSDITRNFISSRTKEAMKYVDYSNINSSNRDENNIKKRRESLMNYYNNRTEEEKQEHKNRSKEINNREDVREKKREKMIGKMAGYKNPFYGQHHTEEIKEKIRQTKEKNGTTGRGIPKKKSKWITPSGEIRYMYKGVVVRCYPDWKEID
jgi:group I intron endonuclease